MGSHARHSVTKTVTIVHVTPKPGWPPTLMCLRCNTKFLSTGPSHRLCVFHRYAIGFKAGE